MKTQQLSVNERVWYIPEQVSEPLTSIFNSEYWREQGKIVGQADGRGTTWFVRMQTTLAALRHYYRGGLFGKLVNDQYVFTGWENTRGHKECALLEYLHQAGVNVPRPIAARAVRHGWWYRADLLSTKIEQAADLVSVLSERSLTREEYQRIGTEIGKMHQALVNHSDLNIHNILLDQQGRIWLIDFDKCQQQKHQGAWQQANIARLKRSFIKEQKKRGIQWQLVEFNDVLEGYRIQLESETLG